jgi:hypothetical protein
MHGIRAKDPQLAVGLVYVLDRSALVLLFESPDLLLWIDDRTPTQCNKQRTGKWKWAGTRRFHAHKAKASCDCTSRRLGVD